jgi:hypothetical protein
MSASAVPVTPSRSRGPVAAKPEAPPRHSGTDQAALTELRNACATYDYLRSKGDPAQFWEMLRLARSRRALLAPPEGAAPAPAPDVETGMVDELDALRRHYAPLVRNLRRYLKNVPGLPEPLDRLEWALAFLLVSAREHQGIARWLAEPGKHEAKAGEKLRSLATITDPYREALKPWTLQGSVADPEAREIPDPPRPAPVLSIDAGSLETLRLAVRCREALAGIGHESELWETMLLVTMEPQSLQAALKPQADREALRKLVDGVGELREMYSEWVHSLRTFLTGKSLGAADPRAFEVGLGLLLATPSAQDRLGSWLEDPATGQEEVPGLLAPSIRRAQRCLAAMTSPKA